MVSQNYIMPGFYSFSKKVYNLRVVNIKIKCVRIPFIIPRTCYFFPKG